MSSSVAIDSAVVTWTCEICGSAIADGEGYVAMSFAELHANDRAVKSWEERNAGRGFMPVKDFISYPTAVRWHVLHAACDPDLDASSYWFPIERMRTPADVIARSAHLLGKRWIQATDWDALLRDVAARLGGHEL